MKQAANPATTYTQTGSTVSPEFLAQALADLSGEAQAITADAANVADRAQALARDIRLLVALLP